MRRITMASSWVIYIDIDKKTKKAIFTPDVLHAKAGEALGVIKGDLVRWYNRSNRVLVLELLPAGPRTEPIQPGSVSVSAWITEPIQPGSVSSPAYQPQDSLNYHCMDPPNQHHSIWVDGKSPPAPLVA
jgi:hypothetical protein